VYYLIKIAAIVANVATAEIMIPLFWLYEADLAFA
jgi:hypothetical protein